MLHLPREATFDFENVCASTAHAKRFVLSILIVWFFSAGFRGSLPCVAPTWAFWARSIPVPIGPEAKNIDGTLQAPALKKSSKAIFSILNGICMGAVSAELTNLFYSRDRMDRGWCKCKRGLPQPLGACAELAKSDTLFFLFFSFSLRFHQVSSM